MKIKWIILIVLAALITGAFVYLKVRKSDDFEPQIKAKLAKLVSDGSNGLYKLDMDHIEIDITAASVTAKNVMLVPDSVRMTELEKAGELGNDIYTLSLKNLDLQGLSPLALLDGKNIDLGTLVLESPEITIVHKKRNVEKKDTGNLYERIAQKHQSYSIKNLLLKNIQLTVTNLDKNKKVSSFKNLSASFADIRIDSSTVKDSSRFLFAKDATLFMKGFSQVTAKNKYHFDIDSVALKPQDGSLQFFDLRFKPEGSKEEFSERLTHQQDRYDLNIKKGNIKNINWFSLLAGDGFFGDEVTMDGGLIRIYHDRSLAGGGPKQDNFPHQMLMNAGIPISIKKVQLNNLFLSYEELNPKSGHTGIVEFNNINGGISNVTNIASEITNDHFTVITASAAFMNTGKLNAVFKFDLAKEKQGNFTVDATLGEMDGLKLNKMTEGLALVKIKELTVDKLQAHIDGSHTGATGNIQFAYHDLSFDVLKNSDEGELKKRGVFTFIVNKFMTNRSGNGKQYTVYHEHDPSRSFFNLIWKTILDGILKTVK